ncbi:ATP-binding cassette sub-family A member 7-like isoform X2 [Mizuhopecten yessoensis]|uniref:ATP-binding cassette sub-family A member 7-like isoform X2 n=1 Tax=Mizuhopecten yessoensis TaxID=6573 RepID=UPI000B459AF4|nr:ATP-binding cassette sub-family A member 7-like isoform X2 [Mizuhopecten yessoensis]
MGFGSQLLLLMWKNYTLRKRQKFRLLLEILFPLTLFFILVIVRQRPDLRTLHGECHFEGKAMPSAGNLPWLQGLVCTYNNTCHDTVTTDEMAGQVQTFNTSLLSEIVRDITRILEVQDVLKVYNDIVYDYYILMEVLGQVQNGTTTSMLNLGNFVGSRQNLTDQLQQQNISLSPDAIDKILNSSINLNGYDLSTANEILTDFSVCQQNPLVSSADDFRSLLCTTGNISQLLVFQDPADAAYVLGEICGLDEVDFTQAFQILLNQFDPTSLSGEIGNFITNTTGRATRTNPAELFQIFEEIASTVPDFTNLINSASDLVPFMDLFRDISSGNFSGGSVSSIGSMICGREGSFFNFGDDDTTNVQGVGKQGGQPNQGNTNSGTTDVPSVTPRQPPSTAAPSSSGGRSYNSGMCSSIAASLGSGSGSSYIWTQLRPLLQGEIFYYPDTPDIQILIKETNKTFEDLASFSEVVMELDTETLMLESSLEMLTNFTGSCLCELLENATAGLDLAQVISSQLYPLPSFVPSFLINLSIQEVEDYINSNQYYMMIKNPNESFCQFLNNYLVNGSLAANIDLRDTLGIIEQVASMVSEYTQCINFDRFRGFNDYEAFVQASKDGIGASTFFAGLQFDEVRMDSQKRPTFVNYKIRMDPDKVDSTKRVQDRYWRPGPRRTPAIDTKYTTFGFSYIQDMVDHAIIRLQTDTKQDTGIMLQMFPYPCYVEDKFVNAISRSLPLFLVLAWVLTVAMICKNVVYEKEKRLKEVMKIMGLGNLVHWVAWFINAFVVMFITILLLVLLVKGGKVLEFSDPSVLIFFFTVFAISTIMQCFLISVFFSRANLAACCAGFIYFVLYLPYNLSIQWEDQMTGGHKFLGSLSSGVAFGFGCSYIARYEEQAIGIQWYNLAETPTVDDEFNMLFCIIMMLVDSVIYAMFVWYIEAVFPGDFGIPRKWYFPIQKSYWCGTAGAHSVDGMAYAIGESTLELNGSSVRTMEKEPTHRRLGVAIRKLKKVYAQGKKVAVDGLTMNFYEGQITSFLGHNGAGKTTTMSILTGLFPPTEGTAFIYGKDIRTDIDEIRQSIGMCPQHNVLFDHLTVEEHLWFFARMRGLSPKKVEREMEQMIKDVGLPHKRKELSSSLSGGMKRKLSVAIAFCGNSKTVILDEPTAGVDPYARRSIWELLFKVKKNRTILLSTHHMDEADILGDRIAIISQGKLCCCGSSLFLKSLYGSGYYLTMVQSNGEDRDEDDYIDSVEVKKEVIKSAGKYDMLNSFQLEERPMSAGSVRSGNSTRTIKQVEPSLSDTLDEGYADSNTERSDSDPPTPPPESATMIPGFSVERVSAFVRKYVPQACLVEDNNAELTFQLPDQAAQEGKFHKLFLGLEKCHKDLGISSFGISDTSLEEVFLKVTEEHSKDEELDDELLRNKQEETSDNGRIAKSVTRLSFRKKKKSFLKTLAQASKRGKAKVDTDDLLADTESVVSEAVTEKGDDAGFNHKQMSRIVGKWLIVRQFIALFLKRFHRVRRSKKGFLCEIVLPAIFVLLAMIFAEISPPLTEEPALELHPWHYIPKLGDKKLYMFYSMDGPSSKGEKNLEMLVKNPCVGNRCMNPSIHSISEFPCEGDWRSKAIRQWSSAAVAGRNNPQCSCDSGWQRCPDGAGGPEPSFVNLPTTDTLYNMTTRNISEWILRTHKRYLKRRYGGFSFGDVEPEAVELQKALQNASQVLNTTSPDWDWVRDLFSSDVNKVWYNNKGWAAIVAYTNVMNNLILRSMAPNISKPTDYGIVTFNHPVEYTKSQLTNKLLRAGGVDLVIAICMIFAMSFIPASFTMVLIEERASNSKHLQFVSGVNPTVYWISNTAWDMMSYFVSCVLMLFIFLAFGREAYVGPMNGPCLLALLFFYGWAMIPVMHPFSRLFSIPSTAMVTLQSINIFLGTTSTMATFILEFLERDDEELKNINILLKKVFLIFPQYCLGRGLMDMSTNQLYAEANAEFGFSSGGPPSPFEFDQVGKNLLALFIVGLVFFIFNILIEYNFCIKRGIKCFWQRKPTHASLEDEDPDVARERKRIMEKKNPDDVLRIAGLTKVYGLRGKKGRNTAVDSLCVGVPKGQCFGLLGVNGAGKTTTFKMLTGDVSVSEGNAYVNGHSILSDMVSVHRSIGYCPQFDAFDSLLTGREILSFYARLRGIPEKDIKEVAEWAIRKLNLLQYADKLSEGYSGGNKRKLSTAISLIGNPSIIFLDEPTTGMDPRARRFLWNCINAIVKDGRSVILTSHSMEECEALCSRLGIMVNGRFMCMGSTQHLKNRFGEGYTVIFRVAGERPNLKRVHDFIMQTFAGAELKEKHYNMVQYQLKCDVKLSNLFRQIEEVRQELNVEDYSVSQTTMDQVFINFAKLQTDLLDDEPDQKELDKDLDATTMPVTGMSGETNIDEESVAGSTLDLLPGRNRSVSDVDRTLNLREINNRYEYTDEESLAGSTVDLIRPGSARSSQRSTLQSNDFPNVDIF